MENLIFLVILFSTQFTKQSNDFEYVLNRYNDRASQIQKIEYHAHRIDTFTSGSVWNNKGFSLIEREKEDSIFGFYFYGISSDIERSFIYDEGVGFNIDNKTESYEVDPGHPGMLGSPGGQMIVQELLELKDDYKTGELIEKKDIYILKFTYRDNEELLISQKTKVVELDKKSFLVTKVVDSYIAQGSKAVFQVSLSNIKINEAVKNSISDYKNQIESFTLIPPKKAEPSGLLNKKVPDIELSKLMNEDVNVKLRTGKVTLLDFWEVWCGYCLKSLPEVEKINELYSEEVKVIGIVTQDKEKAISIIRKKNGTFLNLIGNKEILRKFGVNSWPRYFLIDGQGIIRKEYFSFSEQIEKDLAALID